MIQGIFYARFLPEQGIRIVAQSPPGCIVPVDGVSKPPLFDFSVLQEYIIPRKAFFNRYVTVADPDGRYSVLGFPVSIPHPKYHRNEFIFNFGLVVECDVDQVPYERVVRRLAVTFAEMEKQNEYLSQDGRRLSADRDRDRDRDRGRGRDGGNRRSIEALLEIIKEDLNNYGECMIPVDEANTINMKLFPYHPTPPDVKGWHVPVAKMKLSDVVDPTWDPTLQRVIAYIDGVNDVRRIAFLADVSLGLARLALRHLLYYDTVLLLDMFFFGNCYAPRPGIREFVANARGVVDECANYVCVHGYGAVGGADAGTTGSREQAGEGGSQPQSQSQSEQQQSSSRQQGHQGSQQRARPVSNYQLIRLMTSFCAGKSVAEWLKTHLDSGFDVLRHVDVRRLVQFGVIKGYLYRMHKLVVSKQYLAALATGQARPLPEEDGGDPLQRYTDGCHTFDQIVTELNLTDAEIMEKLKSFPGPIGDLTVFYR